MLLSKASESDVSEIVALANLAYRGTSESEPGWNIEAGIIDGLRLTEAGLREDLAASPESQLLLYRDVWDGSLVGTVQLDPNASGTWALGLLTIRPAQQGRQLGRSLLGAAEEFARSHGANALRITVINLRTELIAWYRRRGYILTGDSKPFHGDDRVGHPLREDIALLVLEKSLYTVHPLAD
jgi:GNAT superfamily N-acetyltransferase